MGAACGGGGAPDGASSVAPATTGLHSTTTTNTTAQLSEPVSISEETEAQLVALMESGNIPSLAAAIVIGDEVIWVDGYGEQPAHDTVYMVGSIEKVFIATAVMQLAEQGLIDIEADIGTYLPFEIRNPMYPDTPVTIEDLMLHRSGLINALPDSVWYDNDATALSWAVDHLGTDLSENPYEGGRPSLGEYLASYFEDDGANGGTDLWVFEPGSNWQYSNLGVQLLLAHIVERVTGQTIGDYIETHVLTPLGMENSYYEASDFTIDQLAIPYTRVEGVNTALPATGHRASNGLRTSAGDLALFLLVHMNGGSAAGAVILQPESIEAMHDISVPVIGTDNGRLPFRGIGYGWWLWSNGRSGHGGATPGYLAMMVMQETEEGVVGIVVMVNVGCSLSCDQQWHDDHFVPMRELLLAEARRMLTVVG